MSPSPTPKRPATPNSPAGKAALGKMGDKELRAKLRLIFDKFDVDGSGTVSTDEMGRMVTRLKMEMTKSQVQKMMADADKDNSGEVPPERRAGSIPAARASRPPLIAPRLT